MSKFRQPVRFGVSVVTLAAVALLMGSGGAAAHPAEPTVVDSCAATLKDQDGQVLTIDLAATVSSSDVLDLSLGSGSGLLQAPLENVLDRGDVGAEELVVNTAGEVCDTAQATVATLAEPLQTSPADSSFHVTGSTGPTTSESPAPESATGESDHSGHSGADSDSAADSVAPGSVDAEEATEADQTTQLGPERTSATVPPPTPATASDSEPTESGETPDPESQDTHIAQTVSTPEALGALPLLLAVTALVLVSSALVRTWLRHGRM